MAERSEKFIIDRSRPGERIDRFLSERYPMVSRGALQRLLEESHITVNGLSVKPTHAPRAGEEVSVTWPEAKPAEAQPEDIPLDILFEDRDLIVINKTPGLVVHPAAGHEEHTMVNALLHHCAGQLSGIGGVARPGIVHRLDKDTSGCLVVAKNDETHLALSAQFAERTTEKTYLAVVCGEISRDSGEIHAAIARHPTHRKRMAVSGSGDKGREAHTSYRVVERFPNATLAEARLHTGRTHQLRVHFLHIGFPIAGDETYGARATHRLEEQFGCTFPRVMLHARKLAFVHPRTNRRRAFTAPVPEDFERALAELRAQGGDAAR